VGAESVLALMERVSQACKVITVRPAEQEHPPGDTAHYRKSLTNNLSVRNSQSHHMGEIVMAFDVNQKTRHPKSLSAKVRDCTS